MLHRSFKPEKCKTSLRLASSRLKLLKNKREVQLKQLKRELAQFLESGQDQTARIRVEHVVREEKTMAAYELLEIYCELIAARLPIIESQKNCPIDLKEAITSVIFASPRCADIPELMDVRKHFTAKYGKEFISAAVELRPDCGVSRMLVEKLSAKAPDGQTKLKILSAIAEEHNVKWDPESFGEKEFKPPDDLLNGPNTFEKASKMHTEPFIFQAHMSNVNATPSHDQKLHASVNFEQNTRSSSSTQTFDSTDIGGVQTTMPASSHPGARPSGNGSERMEISHSESGDGNAFSFDRQSWNMKFKDATAAAQVAAESAERASMAARAAAELSIRGKITRKNSKESQEPNVHGLRNEGPGKNTASKLPREHVAKDSGHNSFHDTNPQIQTQQVDGNEHDSPEELAERFYKLKNDLQKPDRYSQTSSLEEDATNAEKSAFFSELSMNKQAGGSEVEFVNGQQVGQHEDFNYFGEDSIRKQGSSVSSLSNSRYNSFHGRNPQIKNKQADGSEHDNPEELAKRFYMYGQSSTKRSSPSASLDSSAALIDGDKLMNDIQNADIYSERSSFEAEAPKAEKSAFFSETSLNKQSTASAVEYMSGQQVGLQPEEFNYFGEERIRRKDSYDSFNYFGEERIRRKDSYDSSHSQSRNHDDYGISHFSHHKIGVDAIENPFVSVDEKNVHTDTVETSSYNIATVAFDESDSDDDDLRFDTQVGYHGQESNLYSTSQGRDSPAHLSASTDTWSVSQNISESHGKSSLLSDVFSERHLPHEVDDGLTKPAHPSEPDDSLSLKFDDSEGPSSEGEEESDNRPGGKTDPSTLATKQNIYFRDPDHIKSENHGLTGSSFMARRDPGSNRKQDLHFPSDDEELVEVSAEKNQGMEFSKSPRRFGLDEASTSKSLSRSTNDPGSKPFYNPVEEGKSQQSPQSSRLQSVHEVKVTDNTCTPESPDIMKDDENFDQSSLESGKELNLGTLTGGLRNKGYRRPPYIRRPLGDVPSASKKAAEDSTTTIEQSTASPEVRNSLNFEVNTKVKNKSSSRTRTTFKDSVTDDSEEELPQQNADSIQEPKPEPYNTKASAEINTKSRFGAPVTYFNFDDDDSEDPPPKQKLTSAGRVGTGFSRRTKATPSSGMGSSSKARISSGASLNSGTDVKKMTSRSSYGSESPPKPKPQSQSQSQSQSRRVNSGQSGSSAEPGTATSKPMPDSKISTIHNEDSTPSMKEQTSSSLKTLTSGKTENPKASTSSGKAPPSRESSLKKASHVHPKLPDYETIAALLQSHRLNRE